MYIKITTIIKNTKKRSEKKHAKDIKMKEKKKKRNKNLFEEQKKKPDEYRRNYYLTH